MHATTGVSYTAHDYVTAFAEVFQKERRIDLSPDRTLTGWTPHRRLELLDPTVNDWAIRHQASASLASAPRNICRAWAREIWRQLGPKIDGLLVPSTITGNPVIVLFPRSVSAFPAAPAFSRSLDHGHVAILATRVSQKLRWPLL